MNTSLELHQAHPAPLLRRIDLAASSRRPEAPAIPLSVSPLAAVGLVELEDLSA